MSEKLTGDIGEEGFQINTQIIHHVDDKPTDQLREDAQLLARVGPVDMVATRGFREHELVEGAYSIPGQNGEPDRRRVYQLLDPEETVTPVETIDAANKFKTIVDKQIAFVRKALHDPTYQYSRYEVVVGDPATAAVATRSRLHKIEVNPEGGIVLIVAANENFPRDEDHEVPAWSDQDSPDSVQRNIAFGSRTGAALRVQRVIPNKMTTYIDKSVTYELKPGQDKFYIVGVDPDAMAQIRGEKQKPDSTLASWLNKLRGR